ncbi:hypothetical protein NIIDMKKI_63230 [Mycobacterium kansasii]|uniref:Mycofactocin n=4 Tax=Mycobacterium kansasii TaxID=1768 RepID=A0A1V3WKS1_MYCKA|nr:mycofactocin [Mycobacterium kansasii]BCI91117.1 hypothetical protein NIIDMKKI_63230 [Mycobacterium kansasii]
MPAARATSSTLTSANPRAVNKSMATSVMWCLVVERRRPTRDSCSIRPALPFRHSMPYSGDQCDQYHLTLSRPRTKGIHVDHETDTDVELVTETLVEEVSIDGMCGVY